MGNLGEDRLLTPAEVAEKFRVDPKTVTRSAAADRISSIRTPGGHRRFRESEVRALLGEHDKTEPAGADPVDDEHDDEHADDPDTDGESSGGGITHDEVIALIRGEMRRK